MRRILPALGSSAVVLAPRVASACAVCGGFGDDGSRIAYILTTVVLSVLPLAMFGSFLIYVRRRHREAAAQASPRAEGRVGASARS